MLTGGGMSNSEILSHIPPQKTLFKLQDFFKTFGDATRLKILFAMDKEEMCVCQLASALDLNQTTLSHQLSKLNALSLVKKRKVGKMIYYSLDDNHVLEIIKTGLNHINEGKT